MHEYNTPDRRGNLRTADPFFFYKSCASVASIKAVDEPIIAVTHIQKTAPAPPAEIAATTPTRFPIPTRVAVETISV